MDALKFVIQDDEALLGTRIKVIGVGGGGANAVARMIDEGLTGVEFYVINTDGQALNASTVPNKLMIGAKLTHGLGAGSDPAIGRQAALEDTEKIIEILEGADMVFITAGLGGGTGTGAAPVVASLSKELNALTVAVVTKPFGFEGPRRMKQAERGLADIGATVDTVISVANDRLLELAPKGTSFFAAFKMADDILRQAVQGIADIITTPGLINRDFADIRSIMNGMGYAMMGTATGKGENAAIDAAKNAIASPLMEEGGVEGARGVLINITGSSALSLHDVNEACNLIRSATKNDDVQVNFGVVMNESMQDEVKITVIATGFERDHLPELNRRKESAMTETAPMPVFQPMPVPPPRAPEPEPVMEAAPLFEPEEPEIPAAPEPAVADIEIPAYLRRERRLYQ